MAKIITTDKVCSITDVGTVVWFECYFDDFTSLEPFMYDIDRYQNPVFIGANKKFTTNDPIEMEEQILKVFHTDFYDIRYRWWNSKPTKLERSDCGIWRKLNRPIQGRCYFGR